MPGNPKERLLKVSVKFFFTGVKRKQKEYVKKYLLQFNITITLNNFAIPAVYYSVKTTMVHFALKEIYVMSNYIVFRMIVSDNQSMDEGRNRNLLDGMSPCFISYMNVIQDNF